MTMGNACERRRPSEEKSMTKDTGEKGAKGDGTKSSDPSDKEKAKELKDKGNDHFKRREFDDALDCYTEAATLTKYDASIWLNRSLANRMLENFDDAALDAEIAMEIEPSNPKAAYNRALALRAKGNFDAAKEAIDKGLKKNPDNKALQQLKKDVEKEQFELEKAQLREQLQVGNTSVKAAGTKEAQCPASQLGDADIKSKAAAVAYKWLNGKPGRKEREAYKGMLVDMFRKKYQELSESMRRHEENKKKAAATTLDTTQYQDEQKLGLAITGGHRPMKRPDDIKLPADYRKHVGSLTVEQLGEYGCNNKDGRYMLAVYGNIFDVSDRPDKYNAEGPYASLTGKDLTWGLFTGVDTEEFCNRFYDLFKAKDMGKDKMSGLCSWWAWYENEYGDPIGILEPYLDEEKLPAPPLEEVEECCIM